MQITSTQNQPNFKARILGQKHVERLVKKDAPELMPAVKREIKALRKIGSNKTTAHLISYAGKNADNPFNRKGRPFSIHTVVNIYGAQKTSSISGRHFNLTVDELAQKGQETLKTALSSADAQATAKINEKTFWQKTGDQFKSLKNRFFPNKTAQ